MKKSLMIITSILLICAMCITFVACDEEEVEDNSLTIVYIGDSIAEALVGPSPLSERDNYGYYALVGRINNYNYYNISVSGHKTSTGMAGDIGLKELLYAESDNSNMFLTRVKQADVLSISVLGNNALQYDLGLLVLEKWNANWFKDSDWYRNEEWKDEPDYEDLEKEDIDEDIFSVLKNGGLIVRPSVTFDDDNNVVIGETTIPFNFPSTYQDVCDIISKIKELNPDVKILFQKVYNPVFDGTTIMPKAAATLMNGIFTGEGYEECVGTNAVVDASVVRPVARKVLDEVNGILDTYLESHPGAFEILDIREQFEEVAALDMDGDSFNLAADSWGRKCLFADYTHPSNMGHAYIASAIQDWLVKNNLADSNYVQNYKDIKIEQINRMFKDVSGFNAEDAISKINAATTFDAVTEAYFRAIDGYTPIYC